MKDLACSYSHCAQGCMRSPSRMMGPTTAPTDPVGALRVTPQAYVMSLSVVEFQNI